LGEIKKQGIQSTLILGIGVILGFFLKLYVFPAYLEPSEIGLLTVIIDISNVVASLIPLGSQLIFTKYLPKYNPLSEQAQSLRTLALKLTSVGLIVFIILYFFFNQSLISFYQERSELLSTYFIVIFPLVIARVVSSVSTAYSKGQKKTVFPTFTQDIATRVFTLVAVILYGHHVLDLDGLVAAYLGLYMLSAMLVFSSIRKLGGWNFSLKSEGFEKYELKEILEFGGYSILTNFGSLMIRSIDSIMLASLKDLNAAGIYSIAFFIGVLVEIPRKAISGISFPFLSSSFANNKLDEVQSIYKKSALNQLLTGAIIFVCILAGLDDLFKIIPNGHIYSSAASVVIIIGMAKLVDLSTGGNAEVLSNSKYFKFNFLSLAILAPLGIGTNLIFIPWLGFEGAAWASLISMFTVNTFRIIIIYWKLKMLPFSMKWLQSAIVVGSAIFLSQILPGLENPYLSILFKSGVSGMYLMLTVYFFKLSPDLVEIANNMLKRK
jgi:O-antigen/teichoic acid export membrane protein